MILLVSQKKKTSERNFVWGKSQSISSSYIKAHNIHLKWLLLFIRYAQTCEIFSNPALLPPSTEPLSITMYVLPGWLQTILDLLNPLSLLIPTCSLYPPFLSSSHHFSFLRLSFLPLLPLSLSIIHSLCLLPSKLTQTSAGEIPVSQPVWVFSLTSQGWRVTHSCRIVNGSVFANIRYWPNSKICHVEPWAGICLPCIISPCFHLCNNLTVYIKREVLVTFNENYILGLELLSKVYLHSFVIVVHI